MQKKVLILVVGILAVVALIALSFFVFWSNIEQGEIARSEQDLLNIAESNVKAANFTIQSYIDELKTIAFAVERYDDFKSAEPMNLLKNISETYGYERLAIAYPDGTTYASDGNILSISSITKLEHIKKGDIFVQDVVDALLDKKPIINIFVPLRYKTGEPAAALRLTVSTKKFTETLERTFFSGGGFYYLIDKNGRFAATNLPEEKVLEQNYFDGLKNFEFPEGQSAEELRRGFAELKTGFAAYAYGGVERYVHYTPAGINEWILLTVVPKHIIAAPQNEIFYHSALLMLQLLAIITAVFAYFYMVLSKRRRKAELDEECFRALSEQTEKIIFEWDFAKGSISSTSNFEKMFGRKAVTKSSAHEALDAEMIHPDDRALFAEIFGRVFNGESFKGAKIRIKDAQGLYKWCNFASIVIKDNKAKPYKAIASLESIHDQVTREETLRQKAERDQLTGLFNKLTTEYLIKEAITSHDPSKGSHALFIIDIDNFKTVNDAMGHFYGDIVLTLLADLLKPLFRTDDILGRIGGDEFFVMLKNFHSESLVESKAAEICKLFNRSFSENDKSCNVSASVGIAIYPHDGEDFDALYKNADAALYIAKANGKNGYTFFDPHTSGDYKSTRTDIEQKNALPPQNFRENKFEYIFKLLFESDSPSSSARAILQLVVTQYDFSGSYIYELNEDETLFTNTYEYIADGSVSAMDDFRIMPASEVPEIFQDLKSKGQVLLNNLSSLPPDARELISGVGIKSLYLFGIAQKGKLAGFIGFDDCRREHKLTEHEIYDLRTVCDLLFTFIRFSI